MAEEFLESFGVQFRLLWTCIAWAIELFCLHVFRKGNGGFGKFIIFGASNTDAWSVNNESFFGERTMNLGRTWAAL